MYVCINYIYTYMCVRVLGTGIHENSILEFIFNKLYLINNNKR